MHINEWNVIIVDDIPDNLKIFHLVFSFHNITYRTASSGAECLALMEAEPPTLVITDIHMPEMDGIALLERIRANNAWQNIPVIATTAYTHTYEQDRLLHKGFNGFLSKPVTAATAIKNIQTILETYSLVEYNP